jgi:hypothetical protein
MSADEPTNDRFPSRDLADAEPGVADRILTLLPLHVIAGGHGDASGPDGLTANAPDNVLQSVIVRVSKTDYRAVVKLIGPVLRPVAVLLALTEQAGVVKAAADAAREHAVKLGLDPVVFRFGLDGFRSTKSTAKLGYVPAEGDGPLRDLTDEQLRTTARLAIQEQAYRHQGLLVGATVVVGAIDDPALDAAVTLLDASVAARATWGTDPILAPLVLDLAGFLELRSQVKLVRRLARARRPEAFHVALDRLHAGARAERIAVALRLLVLLEQSVAPVYLAKSGQLRRLVAAYDLGGYEVGLGRLDRFSLGDFTGDGGGGAPPAKVEIPSLIAALPIELAHRVLASGIVPESSESADIVRWNAECLAEQARLDASRSPAERRAALRNDLTGAQHLLAELHAAGIEIPKRYTGQLRTWPKAMDLADAWGLHDAGRIRALREQADDLGDVG